MPRAPKEKDQSDSVRSLKGRVIIQQGGEVKLELLLIIKTEHNSAQTTMPADVIISWHFH